MKKFSVGQDVTWSSSSNGSTTAKVGVVVAVIPAGKSPDEATWRLHMPGSPRDHDSYVINVGGTEKRRGKNYWPHVWRLKAVEVAA